MKEKKARMIKASYAEKKTQQSETKTSTGRRTCALLEIPASLQSKKEKNMKLCTFHTGHGVLIASASEESQVITA